MLSMRLGDVWHLHDAPEAVFNFSAMRRDL